MAKRRSRTQPVFRKDLQDALLWSEKHFGAAAADRYRVLIRQALRDLFEEPHRPGVTARPDLAQDVYLYHLIFSRDNVPAERVNKPRHFILYRYAGEIVEFARLLHDSRDLARHVPRDYRTT